MRLRPAAEVPRTHVRAEKRLSLRPSVRPRQPRQTARVLVGGVNLEPGGVTELVQQPHAILIVVGSVCLHAHQGMDGLSAALGQRRDGQVELAHDANLLVDGNLVALYEGVPPRRCLALATPRPIGGVLADPYPRLRLVSVEHASEAFAL